MTSCARSRAWSLARRWPMWVFTVPWPTCRWSQISLLDRPRAISDSTSRSRSVTPSSPCSGDCPGSASRANSAIRRRVIDGASRPSPAATTLLPRQLRRRDVLQQKSTRAGPERGVHEIVQVEHGQDQHADTARLGRCAKLPGRLDPVQPWIRTSIRTTSGCSRCATATASAPSAASPTVTGPGVVSISTRKLPRNNA